MAGQKTLGSLLISIGLSTKEADKAIADFTRRLKQTGKQMESIGKTMSIGFTLPFVYGLKKAIDAFDEEAQAVKKLDLALGTHSKKLADQAAALQKVTIYSDDQVITQQAWAAALGHSEAQISDMTTAAVGLAAGLGIGLDQAMEMLHKTTLGATKGLGNLVPGVKDLTKEQLKSGAAIDLVNKKFAGFAELAAKTGAGPLKVFQNRFGDLMEQFGEQALPLLNKIIEKFTALTDWFSKLSPETKKLVIDIGAFVALTGPIIYMTGKVISLSQSFVGLAASLQGVIGKKVGIIGLGIAIQQLGVGLLGKMDDKLTTDYLNGKTSGFQYRMGQAGRGLNSAMLGDIKGGARDAFGKAFGALPEAPKSSLYNGSTNLLLGLPNQLSEPGILAPVQQKVKDLTEGVQKLKREFQTLYYIVSDIKPLKVPDRVNGIGNIKPGNMTNPNTVSGSDWAMSPDGGFQVPDMDPEGKMSGTLEELQTGWTKLGDAAAAAIGYMGDSMKQGEGFLASFGKAALHAAGDFIRAELLKATISNFSWWIAKLGPFGIPAAIASAAAGSALINGILGSIQAPALAKGGATYGPTLAMIGDNPSGKEMVMPWEKTGDFARAIASHMGGRGGGEIRTVIRGRDLEQVLIMASQDSSRMGRPGLTRF